MTELGMSRRLTLAGWHASVPSVTGLGVGEMQRRPVDLQARPGLLLSLAYSL